MSVIKMIACDNPHCGSIGIPECLKPLRPPYGWLKLKGFFMGSGPSIDIIVCDVPCVQAAIDRQAREEAD